MRIGTAARRVISGAAAWVLLATCAPSPPAREPPDAARGSIAQPSGIAAHVAIAPSRVERYCAWFGDVRDGVLYFGEAAFWSTTGASGTDPRADLEHRGPQRVGRFDLAQEAFLPPLPTGAPGARSGTWDVLAHPNGRIYFTTFFERSGWVDPRSGASQRFAEAGLGLNELALGPDGQILVTRYGTPERSGSVVVLDPEGRVLAEHPLAPPRAGLVVAAKSLAFDPVRREVWVNSDLVPVDAPATAEGHDARVLDLASGRERLRVEQPELHFMRFEPDGRGHFAWLDGRRLVLRSTEPGRAEPGAGREVLLDPDFPTEHDFVQDLSFAPDGGVIATRWSGVVHVVAPDGVVRTTRLPALSEGGLYYTAVATGERLCATYCGEVTVVCAPAPN